MVVFFTFWGRACGRAQLGRIQGAAQILTVLASAVGPLLSQPAQGPSEEVLDQLKALGYVN